MVNMRIYPDRDEIHGSWAPFIESQRACIHKLEETLCDESVCPAPKSVLRFANTDLNSAKVVILGQDPYPRKGAATGRAFEVGGLKSFFDPFPHASLKNIIRLIHLSYTNECLDWSELKIRIKEGVFGILPPGELFRSWEEQGVLLINSSLTCREGAPMSHAALWQPFTAALISYISNTKPQINWFLWGKNAVSAAGNAYGCRFASRHPMICGMDSPDDFLKNKCFLKTKDMINWTGI